MKATAVIPARYSSSRLPGKPLLRATGKYLIQHVYEQVRRCRSVSEVIVATDDQRILDAVASFGGKAVMTRGDHPSGTDRVAEVARNGHAEVVINVQGDEPEIEPESIDALAGLFQKPDVEMATLACPFPGGTDPADPNAVKVVVSRQGRALYFSRSLIPYPRDTSAANGPLLHIGIYGYRRDFLLKLANMPPTPLELIEKLEQLRVLEHGHAIHAAIVPRAAIGIDTEADYQAFVERCSMG